MMEDLQIIGTQRHNPPDGHSSLPIANLRQTSETEEHIFYIGVLQNGTQASEVVVKAFKEPGEGVTWETVSKEYAQEIDAIEMLSKLNLGPELLGNAIIGRAPSIITSNSYTRLADLPSAKVLELFTGDNLGKVKTQIEKKARQMTNTGFSVSNVELAVSNEPTNGIPQLLFINPFKLKRTNQVETTEEEVIRKAVSEVEDTLRAAQGQNHQPFIGNNLSLLYSSKFGLTSFLSHTSCTKERFLKPLPQQATLIKKINHGNSSEVFEGNIVLPDGKLKTVAIKMLHDKFVAEHYGWENCLLDFEREERNARVLEKHANGAKVYGFVDVDGNPGLAFEFIEGKHSKEEGIRTLVNDFTIQTAKQNLQELALQGYRLDDIQFFIVDKDSETRRKGEFILTDPGQLSHSNNPSKSFNFMWDCVKEILGINS